MTTPLVKTEERFSEVAQLGPPKLAARGYSHVAVYSSLEELPRVFLNLLEEEGRRDFFQTLPWFQNLIKTALCPDDEVRIYGCAGTGGSGAADGMLFMHSSSSTRSFF